MSERRFFAPGLGALPAEGGELLLSAEVARHARVLRLSAGASLLLFDAEGLEAEAEVLALEPEALRVRAGPPRRAEVAASGPRLVLLLALPKGEVLDRIVRMATELGVSAIVLAISERTVARPEGKKADRRADRLRKIALSAVRQSEGGLAPRVEAPRPLAEVLRALDAVPAGGAEEGTAAAPGALRLAFLARGGLPLAAIAAGLPGASQGRAGAHPEEIWIAIGPEGGFSPREVGQLAAKGFAPATLGPTILRTQTAAIAAIAAVRERFGGA